MALPVGIRPTAASQRSTASRRPIRRRCHHARRSRRALVPAHAGAARLRPDRRSCTAIPSNADGKWREPIGTGPFKLGEWKRGQYIELIRFDGYVSRREPRDGYTGAKKAEVDEVRFNIVPDSSAAKAGTAERLARHHQQPVDPELEDLKAAARSRSAITPALGADRHPVPDQGSAAQGRAHPPRAGAVARLPRDRSTW